MARPKEWERIARDQQLSVQAYFKSIIRRAEDTIIQSGDKGRRLDAAEDLKDAAAGLAKAQDVQGMLEDHDKTAAEMEKQVLANYRIKGG